MQPVTLFIIKQYLGNYSRSEVENSRVGRVWWVVDADRHNFRYWPMLC